MGDSERELLVEAEATIGRVKYQAIVKSGSHTIIADEPLELEGMDTGMSPYNLLLASLASCTIITLRMYIERKMWNIDEIGIALELFKRPEGIYIDSKLTFSGELNDAQKARLITIADACPIHKILVGNIEINNSLK